MSETNLEESSAQHNLERLVIGQADTVSTEDMSLPNYAPTLAATQQHILQAMKDLCEHSTDTVWLTKYETVFERLASLYGYAGGDNSTLAETWPEYFN
jgi:hypothetical protein